MKPAEPDSPQEGENVGADLERGGSSGASSSPLSFGTSSFPSFARLLEEPAILHFFEDPFASHRAFESTDRPVDTARIYADFKGSEFVVMISAILECHRSILSFYSAYAFIQNISA
jgi:hypothetical protein